MATITQGAHRVPVYHYTLTDGQETYGEAFMSQEAADEANQTAQQHTDGNLFWSKVHQSPIGGCQACANLAYSDANPPIRTAGVC